MIDKSFDKILESCLKSEDEYRDSPPKGPPDKYPVLSDEALSALQYTEHGEDTAGDRGKIYQDMALAKGESGKPVAIDLPQGNDLADLHVCGIDGSNQRISKSAFEFILARACIIVFRYSRAGKKPYFYQKTKDSSAVVWIDGNIFGENIAIHTKELPQTNEGKTKDILDNLKRSESPFMVRYERGKMKKSPSSYALGLAVKIQQALELLCIKDALELLRIKDTHKNKTNRMVCIKDGPLFSTSVSPNDTISGLSPIFSWGDEQTLIACSKRVGGSPLLLEAMLNPKIGQSLKELWFPNQVILDDTLNGLASDANLLPRILKPGHRTPLIQAVPIARNGIVKMDKRLTPLSCYYLSRCRPHTYIRMEIPLFKWERNPDVVNYAIKITAWQHELGHSAPLVQMEADNQCDLSAERNKLDLQTANALNKNNLHFLENYDE